MQFLKKQDAINYYNKLKNKNNIYLFQEDINKAGSKCFYVKNPEIIFDKLERQVESHFYEFWTDQSKLVFGVDIDYDTKKNDLNPDQLLINVIHIVFEGAKKYYDHEYKMSDIIILENDKYAQKIDNPNKYSAHIIFRGLEFQNCTVTKDFYLRLDKDYKISDYFVDKSIYNMTCLRLFLNSKMNKTAILTSKKMIIDGTQTMSCNLNGSRNNLYNFFLNSMLTYTTGNVKLITSKDVIHKQERLMPKCFENDNDISNVNIESILMSLPSKYYDDYENWIKVGMILYTHSTEENNLYDLWNRWSHQSDKYKEKEMSVKWDSFAKSNHRLTIGTLIKWAKDEGIANIFKNTKQTIDNIVDNYPIKPIIISTKDNVTTLDQAKLTPDVYVPVLNKKLIAVQSEKGTGKTSNLLTTLFKDKSSWINDDTSVLFISSRITFGYKLFGDLKDYGFELYSQIKDYYIRSKRIICQIDSLMRLEYDKYDVIIVDECESLARYITSTHFTKNNKANLIVSSFEIRLADANQVYIMDADLSDRCINYYKKATDIKDDEMHLIINNFKPYKDYQLTYCHYATWLRKILIMLELNKKLVIAMASNSKAKDLDKKIRDTYQDKKVLLIHKETTDEDKKNILLKVNDEWTKYDVVIYTPSVCMGVSFDITGHFDYIFAYGCHESLGAQEWCQMIHRVRSPVNKEIFIAVDKYKSFDANNDIVSYNSVEKMLCSDYYLTNFDLHTNIVYKKVKRIKSSDINSLDKNIDDANNDETQNIGSVALNDKILYYPYKTEPIYDLYVRNSWELIENKLNFTACFFGYAKYKEYKLEYVPLTDDDKEILSEMKAIRDEREEQEEEENINGIVNANDMTVEEFNEKVKQRNEYITKDDLYEIYRYNIRKCYNIKQKYEPDIEETLENGFITREFVAEYYGKGKMKWYRNIATILATATQSTEEKMLILKENQQYESKISNCYIDFTNKNKYSYHYYPLEIMKLVGFDINNINKTISYPNMISSIYGAIGWCNDYKDVLAYKYNVKTPVKCLIDMKEIEQMRYINKIIESQYGLKIKRINTSANKDNILYRLDDDDKWKDLPDRYVYTDEEYNLKQKIEPYELKYRNINNNNYDTSMLDIDIFIDED